MLTIEHCTCNALADPLGVDVARPRLGWMLRSAKRGEKQTAYRILVASTAYYSVREGGKPLAAAGGARAAGMAGNRAVVEVSSGSYHLTCRWSDLAGAKADPPLGDKIPEIDP